MPEPAKIRSKAFEEIKKVDPNAEVQWDPRTGSPSRLRGVLSKPKGGEPEEIARQFVVGRKDLFTLEQEDLQLKEIVTDTANNRHVRFQQMHKGLPIFGHELLVHMNAENAIRGTNGRIKGRIDVPTKPAISAEESTKIALADENSNTPWIGAEPVLLVIVHEDVPHLAWHVTVGGTDEGLDGKAIEAKWEYFVDASTGKVVWRYNNMQTHTRTTGTGTGKYAGAVRPLNTVHNHATNKYELIDQWLPSTARVYTHNCKSAYPPCGKSEDINNAWSSASQGAEVDCHVFSRTVFDYFLMVHGRNSFDNAGADMHIYAHVGSNWNNASWNGSYVKIGDGDGVTNDSYCTLDIVAHEWIHAVTEHTAGLIYDKDSGALNESMSDVFAALIDGDWLHGEDNWLKTTAPAGRNLADPTNGGQYDPADPIRSVIDGHQPDHTNDKYLGSLDYGGVHINSGIMNKVAYLIATGGTHRGINICQGLGREVLGRLYYQALTSHLMSTSDFSDMRNAVLDSLDDLYSGDPKFSRWRASIINAFAAVGIGTAVICPIVCWTGPIPCPHSPMICRTAPIIVACPPQPMICQTAPLTVTCPPQPTICSTAPVAVTCPPQPIHACLPGPDPSPFTPVIEKRVMKISGRDENIQKISGIGPERAELLKNKGVSTIGDLLEATEEERISEFSQNLGISENRLLTWRKKAQFLVGET